MNNIDFTQSETESTEVFNANYENDGEQKTETSKKVNKWALRGRLRSKVLWVAVLGGVIQIFSAVNLWAKIGITAEGFRELMVGVGAILEAFGVFNDPTNREGF